MARTLYFHIGMGRCGSSAIQGFVRQNREALSQAGITLPSGADLGSSVALRHSGNATGLALTLRNERRETAEATAAIAKAAAHLRAIATPHALLSSEFFYALPVANFAALKRAFNEAGFDVVVVCYIREQREWMISRYGQAVKARKWTRTLEQYMRESFRSETLRYLTHLRPLRELFGAENLIVRVFERPRLAEGDVRKDLCGILGVPPAAMTFDTGDANASGNLLQIELMRAMNGAPAGRHFRFNNRDFLRTTEELFTSGQMTAPEHMYRLVRPRLMKKIGEYFKRENEEFRAEFLPQAPTPLFSDRIPETYPAIGADDHIAADTAVLLHEYVNRVLERDASRPAERRPAGGGAATPGQPSSRGGRPGYRRRAIGFLRTLV
jgi:hypothetical protein